MDALTRWAPATSSQWLLAAAAAVLLINVRSLPFMYHVRIALAFMLARLRPALRENDVSVVRFRVWIDDLDINLHMNNAMYNGHCDSARADFISRIVPAALRFKYRYMNGGVSMFFFHELRLLDVYEVRTRIVGWNRKWIVVQHAYFRAHKCVALGCTKLVVKERSGKTVPPESFFHEIGWDVDKLRQGLPRADTIMTQLLTMEESLLEAHAGTASHGAAAASMSSSTSSTHHAIHARHPPHDS